MTLHDKAVVVTGAGRGLGAAYAVAAAAAGASVVVNDIDQDAAAKVASDIGRAGGRAVAHPADITDWDAAEGLISLCVSEFGAIDGLVNNAGVFTLALPWEQDPTEARRLIEVNLLGTLACGTHALRHMVARGSGTVVNVTSGEQMGKTATAVYGATKAAVATLTYSWSLDARDHGVRVNAVSPNAHTRMADTYQAFRGSAGTQNVGLAPEVNAPLVVYLLSDLSSAVTGQVVRLNGSDLMLCTHPAVLDPVLTRPGWTIEALAEAFAGELAEHLQPVGIQRVRTAPLP
ncbi:SDR family oxidoreductase [Actinokineospora sp. NBRC 105648]|uniref:SDR family NAD(P)-dependent oxidoreductase n=1 Tax=Actinokineospora sp. NBRC 105648 TaxID=3032206 RepID=UPI0024A204E8|nr:SDR family oxidoreductase [Actinokineospora sp. NBRC 105648]GLZ42014.1 short-chain dehydrogenase [Actinokineospora sp. NBRC 105648]